LKGVAEKMLRVHKPTSLGLAGLMAVVAMLGFSAVQAASALAVGGPVWNVVLCEKVAVKTGLFLVRSAAEKCEAKDGTPEGEFETFLRELTAGQTAPLTSSGGAFKLNGITNISCSSEQDTGELIGGNPGTALSIIEFLGCAVEGKTVAECGASNVTGMPGVVLTEVKSVLVYPHEKAETDEEALLVFVPDEAGNLFVEFTLTGTNCGLLNNLKVNVNATGTEIKEPALNKKCGVLARVGKLEAGAFVITKAGEEAITGALNSEGTPTEATLWKPTAKTFELITCKLEAFFASATEVGVSDITLLSGEPFGWEL
jgi:hypothetical protein